VPQPCALRHAHHTKNLVLATQLPAAKATAPRCLPPAKHGLAALCRHAGSGQSHPHKMKHRQSSARCSCDFLPPYLLSTITSTGCLSPTCTVHSLNTYAGGEREKAVLPKAPGHSCTATAAGPECSCACCTAKNLISRSTHDHPNRLCCPHVPASPHAVAPRALYLHSYRQTTNCLQSNRLAGCTSCQHSGRVAGDAHHQKLRTHTASGLCQHSATAQNTSHLP
jgi:hypothetical protein